MDEAAKSQADAADPRGISCGTAVDHLDNRVAPDDYVYPLSGTWVTGYRARRIREDLQSHETTSRPDHRRLQLDGYSGRAASCVPLLVGILETETDPQVQRAITYLREWDYHVHTDSIAASSVTRTSRSNA